ncbi:unnamed protein product [Schistosoma rodhaini]|uniref:Uncharacterized protein n=1 Tax=Schistosoma rodhaini TaxID=6188 RepID=A0AA85GDK5_9TREM|nr:unnamed protein product [Schistosoma rodhaini]
MGVEFVFYSYNSTLPITISNFFDFLFYLELGIDGLAHTRDWIKQAHDDILHVSHQPINHECLNNSNNIITNNKNTPVDLKKTSDDCSTTNNDTIPLTPNNILRETYLKLLTWPRNRDWPEVNFEC